MCMSSAKCITCGRKSCATRYTVEMSRPTKPVEWVPPPTFLAAWRTHAGYDVQGAADGIGASRSTIERLESGEIAYTPYRLEQLARLYGCSSGDLISTDPSSTVDEEARLRSAMLAFGVDAEDLGRAVSSVKVFVDDRDEPQSPAPRRDRSELANPRHVKAPSE